MSNASEMSHDEFQGQMAGYVAGGLTADERIGLEAHVAECGACASALAELRDVDSELKQVLADARPGEGFEDRIVRGVWASSQRSRIHPAVWRISAGLAAGLVVAATGLVAVSVIEGTSLIPLPTVAQRSAASYESKSLAHYQPPAGFGERDATLRGYRNYQEAGGAVDGEKLAKRLPEGREGQSQGGQQPDWQKSGGFGLPRPTVLPEAEKTRISALFVDALKSQTEAGGSGGGAAAHEGKGAAGIDARTGVTANWGFQNHTYSQAGADGKMLGGVKGVKTPAEGEGLGLRPNDYAFFKPAELAQVKGGDENGFEVRRLDPKDAKLAGGGQGQVLGKDPDRPGDPVAQAPDAGPAVRAGAPDETKTPPANPAPANNQAAPPQPAVQQPNVQQQAQRKIIRNGEMEFEVDSFDSTFLTITRVVGEEGGFVSSTSSEKLPNGKVRGTVIVRVPPERLDTLVLKLRALGDLKSQKISAQDVTKVYYDLESELKAGRAMEERLLNIIKSGKGEIKDLLEAEKQLGVYREKIEKLEGEIRYYNNLVSLSTLSITAVERDIRQAAMAQQTENVSMGVESEDVEKARAEALKAIEEAKGRIIESQLKKHDAGQLSATVIAEVSPDASGPLIDRLKQLGRVARLDVERRQSTAEGRAVLPGVRVERRDTRFAISIYNLANIAPRQTTNLNLAVPNVEEAYRAILAVVNDRKGRVVTSSLNRQKAEQTTGVISFEVPSGEADVVLNELRREREVMGLTVTENPDTQNVTTAKRGFSVQIHSLATVPARENEQLVIAVKGSVAEAFRNLVAEARKADARILTSQLNEQDKSAAVGGVLDVEVMRGREVDLRQALVTAGDTISRNVNRAAESEGRVDSKVLLQVRLVGMEQLAPRETQTLGVAAKEVPAAHQALVSAVLEAGGRIVTSELNEQDRRNVTGTLAIEFLRADGDKIDRALSAAGAVYTRSVTRSPDVQNTVDTKVRMNVTMVNVAALPPRESGKLGVVVGDVSAAAQQAADAAVALGGRVTESRVSTDSAGQNTATVAVDVPLRSSAQLRSTVKGLGEVRADETSINPGSPDSEIGRARFEITLQSRDQIVGRDDGIGATLRRALATSAKGLLVSLQVLVVGLLFVVPWVLLIYLGYRLVRRARTRNEAGPTPSPAV